MALKGLNRYRSMPYTLFYEGSIKFNNPGIDFKFHSGPEPKPHDLNQIQATACQPSGYQVGFC